MTFHYNYRINEIENLIPFERDIYVGMIKNYQEEQEEASK
jgi:hypothetical protein